LTRRQAILAVLALPLADVRAFAQGKDNPTGLQTTRARLRIPLDQWGFLSVTLKGKTVDISVDEIFATIAGEKA